MNKMMWACGLIVILISAGQSVRATGETASTNATMGEISQGSNAIEKIEYNAETKLLMLSFKRGTYKYEDVPAEVYQGLQASDSKGTYFKQNIRGKYKTTKVSAD